MKRKIYNFVNIYLLQNRSTKQIIFKNTFWLMFAEVISKSILFFVTVVITRYLGVEEYGKFSFALTFTSLFSVLMDFGFNSLISRDIPKKRELAKKYTDNILAIKIILSLITFIAIFILINLLNKSADVRNLIYLASVYVVIQGFLLFFQFIFQSFEKMQYSFISRVSYTTFLLILAVIFIFLNLESFGILYAYILSTILALLISSILIRKYFVKFFLELDFKFWRYLIKESFPFFAGLTCTMIYVSIDSVFLGIFRNYQEVGLYQAAYKIFFVFQTINLVHQALVPKLSALSTKKDLTQYNLLMKKVFLLSFSILIPIAIIISLFSKELLSIIYGIKFIGASFALQTLIWTEVLIFFSSFWGYSLMIINKQNKWFYSVLIGAVSNVVLNIIFLPKYGLTAAAIITLISEIAVFVSYIIYTPSNIRYFLLTSKK